jgi:hypothetical protein
LGPAGAQQRLQARTFSFEQEQEAAEKNFSACGDGLRHPAADKVYLIEATNRPGALMPIMESEHGIYTMNSKDLRAVELIVSLTAQDNKNYETGHSVDHTIKFIHSSGNRKVPLTHMKSE